MKDLWSMSTPPCSRGSVVDNKLDYQSRDCKIDPPFLGSFG